MLDSKKIKLITLCENTAKWLWLLGEWGWSMLVETEDLKLLFDTGFRASTTYNANMMGIDLESIDRILLSHGHMDHTGGLRDVLQAAGTDIGRCDFLKPHRQPMDIIAHPDIWGPKFIFHKGDNKYSFRGLPFRRIELVERQNAKFVESRKPVWITEDIVWSGEIPRNNDFEEIAPICFIKKEGATDLSDPNNFETDPLNDDAALYLRTDKGIIIVLGCGHHGLINTIHHAQKLTGTDKVHMVIGGTHLCDASEHQLNETIKELKRLKPDKVGVSHCTGFLPSVKLLEALGSDVFFPNQAGNVITF